MENENGFPLQWILVLRVTLPMSNYAVLLILLTSLSYCSSEKFEPIEVPRPSPPKVKREIPPYNGFGSEEDSLASCLNLIPKPPRRCVHCHRFTAMEVIHKLGSINTGIS